jgi:hypothetical protein
MFQTTNQNVTIPLKVTSSHRQRRSQHGDRKILRLSGPGDAKARAGVRSHYRDENGLRWA